MAETKESPFLLSKESLKNERAEFVKDRVMSRDGAMFSQPYGAGYWLYGLEYITHGIGWLAFEFDETTDYQNPERHVPACEILKAWIIARTAAIAMQAPIVPIKLPPKYFLIDQAVGEKMFDVAVQRWGEVGLADMDLPRVDVLLQWVLLGEIRYG